MTDKTDLLTMPKGEAVGMYQAWSYDQMQAYATPAEQDLALRKLAHRLDRLTARFTYVVIAATVLLFVFHGIRFAARIWGLS